MSTLLIRADAAPRMGTGHVMRCLALAQAARREGLDVHMICRLGVDWLRERLAREDIPLHCLPDMPPVAEEPDSLLLQLQMDNLAIPETASAPIWVVLDGYHFDTACQLAVMRAGYRLLVIDDYAHLPEYHCDILLNQNIGSELLDYNGEISHKLFGLDYVILRQEFFDIPKDIQTKARHVLPQRILITLGGGDFIEYLEKIAIDMITPELAGRSVRVIQGAMDRERIHKAFSRSPVNLEILSHIDNMPAILMDTDLCITAGGSTCWELCYLHVPFRMISIAENQQATLNFLSQKYQTPFYTSEDKNKFNYPEKMVFPEVGKSFFNIFAFMREYK